MIASLIRIVDLEDILDPTPDQHISSLQFKTKDKVHSFKIFGRKDKLKVGHGKFSSEQKWRIPFWPKEKEKRGLFFFNHHHR